MRINLRSLVLAPVMMAAAALAANSAMAETLVKVPFSFTVAGKTLPAGTYSVKRDTTGGNIVTMRSQETSQALSWVVGPGNSAPTDKVTLNFDGDSYTHNLRSLQYGSLSTANLKVKYTEHAPTQTVPGQ